MVVTCVNPHWLSFAGNEMDEEKWILGLAFGLLMSAASVETAKISTMSSTVETTAVMVPMTV